ncbi:MAG: hypothetical protein GTO40_22055 [Deltaproteobacteria bacterium]|nr:hypothetical protein [Deltaproteobacteria bacterium]
MRIFLAASLLLLLAGCTNYRVVSGGEVKRDRVEEIKIALAEMRGLNFTSEVPIEVKSKAEMGEYLEASLVRDYGDQELENLSLAYAKLGLLPQGLDLKAALLKVFSDQVVAFYDPKVRKLLLPADLVGGVAVNAVQFLAQRDIMGEMVLAHELTHALQEQHFAIGRKLDLTDNDDRTLAFRCVVEGDALLAGFGTLWGHLDDEKIEQINASVVGNLQETRSSLSEDVPAAIMEQLLFQYYGGISFVSRTLKQKGWRGIDQIFANPPQSTEQVLHPEKYIDKPDPPTLIELRELSPLFPSEWEEIENNVLGELMVRVLFTEYLSEREGKSIAEGWDGDRFIAYRDGDRVAFVWAAVWDSFVDAKEFAENYEKILSRKNRGQEMDNFQVYIEQRERKTLVVEGLGGRQIRKQIENIWRKMRLKEEAPPKPFSASPAPSTVPL